MHKIFACLLIAISTNFLNLPVKDPTFQLPKQIIFSPTSFFAPRTRQVKCENSCSFDTTCGCWCNALLRRWQADPRFLIIISRYSASLRRWRPDSRSFITISEFRHDASLRGWRSNKVWLNFIFININCFNAELTISNTTLFLSWFRANYTETNLNFKKNVNWKSQNITLLKLKVHLLLICI
jgi:hypothetical protein